jgi:hypothetical protein
MPDDEEKPQSFVGLFLAGMMDLPDWLSPDEFIPLPQTGEQFAY